MAKTVKSTAFQARKRSEDETPTTRERFAALRHVVPFLKMVWRSGPGMALANGLLRVVRAAFPLAKLYVGKLIIDAVVELVGGGVVEMRYVWMLIGAELLLAVLSSALSRLIALLDGLLGDKFSNDISVRLMRHAADLDLAHFEDAAFYDKLERARQQTYSRHVLMTRVLTQFQNLITMLFLGAGLVVMAPWLIVLLIIALVPAFLGEAHFNARTYSLIRGWTEERRELDYLRYAGASAATAKEVKIFGLAQFLANRYRDLADAYYQANRSLAIRRALWGMALALIGSAGYYGAYAVIVWRTIQGEFSVGDLTFLAGSFMRLQSLFESFLTGFNVIADQAMYLKDLFDFFEIKPGIKRNPEARTVPRPIQKGFEFENVSFKYPGTDHWANRNLSFTLRAGEVLALVGENGAGKTTLVKLLARLYDPDEGRILLDGVDLREYNVEELRHRIGVIFQDYVRYDMEVGQNIAVGRIEERANQPRIQMAADQSLAASVIDKLPAGFDQMLGRRFKDGVELSGGEWQKVALARAYMRDADVLILDEPTAALDARAEYEVFQRFAELTEEKTAVLISHRFSTVRMADRILVLEKGSVLEQGTHEELLALDGRYAELFTLQAQGYQ